MEGRTYHRLRRGLRDRQGYLLGDSELTAGRGREPRLPSARRYGRRLLRSLPGMCLTLAFPCLPHGWPKPVRGTRGRSAPVSPSKGVNVGRRLEDRAQHELDGVPSSLTAAEARCADRCVEVGGRSRSAGVRFGRSTPACAERERSPHYGEPWPPVDGRQRTQRATPPWASCLGCSAHVQRQTFSGRKLVARAARTT